MIIFEQLLNQDLQWALEQGSIHLAGEGAVSDALRAITRRLDELKVSYAVVGGMALFIHGYRRFTDVVDILVTREGLKKYTRG